MLLRSLLIVQVLFASSLMLAESPSTHQVPPTVSQVPIKNLPVDSVKTAALINASFYRPDQLPGIQCAVAIDWNTFYESLKVKVPEARMHAIDGLQIHYTALRDKAPDVTFNWVNGPADTQDQLEVGVRQIIGGFYRTYWSFMASPPIPKSGDIGRIEPQPDGTTKVFESDANNKIEIDLDKNHAPAHYAFDTPAFKGSFDLQYTDSPKPVPGDLRRISQLHVLANVGASSFNVAMNLDYQPVEGFYIPRHVSYDLVGAYSVSMEFIGCSTSKAPAFVISPAQ